MEKAYQFVLWLIPTVEKFLLGDRIQSAALDVLTGLIEATYSRNHAPSATALRFCLGRKKD